MGQFFPNDDQFPIEDQIKTLADDELLDFWEETQHLEQSMVEDLHPETPDSLEYERIILQELMLRSCMRVFDAVR